MKNLFKTLKSVANAARLVKRAKDELQRHVEPVSFATDLKTGKIYPVFLCSR